MPELVLYDPIDQPKTPPPSESARGATQAGVGVLTLFFGGLGGWAATAPLTGAVVAPAVVKVEGNRKSIQHLDGGIVRELKVREGDRVEAGQTVIVLEDTQARASVAVLAQQRDVSLAQEARLIAERDGASEVSFSRDLVARRDHPDVATLLDTETRQFAVRRTALTGQIAVLKQRVEALQEQIKGLEAQQISTKEQIELIAAELKDQHDLLRKNLTLRSRVLQLERSASALKGQSGEIAANIARARQTIGEVEMQMMQLRNERMTEVAKDLRETQAKLLDVIPRLQAAQDALDRTVIRTPYAGYVVALAVFSVGGVIVRGEKVMDVVPTMDELAIEASVNVDDIHDVLPGMRAEVHFTAYKQRVLPVIRATVMQVSADRLTDPKTSVPYYTALIKVDEKDLAEAKDVKLYPGMAATVMIPTKERTALDYLLSPVMTSFDAAFRQK